MESVRHHSNLVEIADEIQFQIVSVYAGNVNCRYAASPEEADELVARMLRLSRRGVGLNNNRLNVEVRQRGDFVADYEDPDDEN